MDSRRFLVTVVGAVVAICAGLAAINVRLNVYGVFGDARGESRHVVTDERWTKFMYTFNYIPANFDGMLIGSSVSDNLDTSRIQGYRVYNACFAGGSGGEANRMVSSVLDHGAHLRLLLVSLDTAMLKSATLKAGGMQQRDYWSALGSTQLLGDYVAEVAVRVGVLPDPWTAYGMADYETLGLRRADADAVAAEQRLYPPEARAIDADSDALELLGALVARARAHGARIVGFFPPVYEPIHRIRDFRPLEQAARALLAPDERIVDFNNGTFSRILGRSHPLPGWHAPEQGRRGAGHRRPRRSGGPAVAVGCYRSVPIPVMRGAVR